MQYTKDKIMATDAEKRVAKNKALANSAKGKTQTPTAEAARRAANKEVTGKSVKVVPSLPTNIRKSKNAMEETRVSITKSGALAKGIAETKLANVGVKNLPIKINSAKVTPQGTQPALRIRSTGGLGGGGGTLRNSIR